MPTTRRSLARPARPSRDARETGTAAVGDISNSLATVEAIRAGGLRGLVFHELLGFNLPNGDSVRDTRPHRATAANLGGDLVQVSVAPHAPYSVSPELFRAIREEVDASAVPITSVHLAESDSEVAFLRDGSGPWPAILKWVGSTRDDWAPPGAGPVAYLDSLGVLDARTLVVHGVQLGDDELARLAEIGCTLVTCPRSNQWVGVGVPPIARFYAAGVKVAVGTDSLASVADLNLFEELKTMRWLAPGWRPGGCSRARRASAPRRSVWAVSSARSSRASVRRCWRCRSGTAMRARPAAARRPRRRLTRRSAGPTRSRPFW